MKKAYGRRFWMWRVLGALLVMGAWLSTAQAASFLRVDQFDEESIVGWSALTASTADGDDDGATDLEEGNGDRDGDGIPDDQDYDPTGYFYDQADGRILSGGGIAVFPPAGVNLIFNGSTGFYQFTMANPGTYTIAMTPPPGYTLATQTCPSDDPPALSVPSTGNPLVLGAGEVGASGFLSSNACSDYYFTLTVEPGDDDVFNNNFPFVRSGTALAPAASTNGLVTLVLLLLMVAAWRVGRATRPSA